MMIESLRNATLNGTIVVSILFMLVDIVYQLYQRRKCEMAFKKTENPILVYNTDCPICLNIPIGAIVADCKHAYCLECLHVFSMNTTWKNLCPLCRQLLRNLKFLENENCKYSEAEKEKIQRKIANILKPTKQNVPYLVSLTAYKILLFLLWSWIVVNRETIQLFFMVLFNLFLE